MKKNDLPVEEMLSSIEQKQERGRTVLKIFIILAVVTAVVCGIYFLLDNLAVPENNRSALEQAEKQGDGKGYPYFLRAADVRDSGMVNGNLVLSTQGKVIVLNKNAKEVSGIQHTCKNPAIEISGNHILLYDREGKYVRLQDEKQVLWEQETPLPILKATLTKSGKMIFAVRDEKYASSVILYDKNFKELFTWNSSSEYIMDMAVSDNGRYMAVTAFATENAQLNSKVIIIDLKEQKEIGSFTYSDTTLFDVSFADSKTVVAVGDTKRVVITDFKNGGEEKSYENLVLKQFADCENGAQVFAFSEYSSNKNVFTLYKGEKEVFSYSCTGTLKGVACDGKRVSVLVDGKVITLNSRGKEIGSSQTQIDALRCYVSGRNTYVLSAGAVERYNNHKK